MKKKIIKQISVHHGVRKRRVVFSFWQEMKLIITMGNSKLTFPFVFFANQLLIVTFSHHRFQQTCDFSQIPNREPGQQCLFSAKYSHKSAQNG